MSDTATLPPTEFTVELVQGGMKAAMKDNGATSRDLLMVPIDNLKVVAGLNVRVTNVEYEEHLEFLKNSIVENGFYQHMPLSGYAGKEGDSTFIYVTGGFSRLEAAKRAIAEGAMIENLPVVLKPPGTSMADLMLALDVDNTGKPLSPYERGTVIKRLISYGWSEADIAKRMRITPQYTKDLLYLMGLPNGLRQQVISGRAAAAHVVQIARKVGPSEALKAFEASAPKPAEGGGGTADAGSSSERINPRATAAAAAEAIAKKPVIPKKTLFLAIDYAIALPGDGLKWLARWRKGEIEAVAELATYKPPRKTRADAKPKAGKKAAGKGGKKKAPASVTANGAADPFDINGNGDKAEL